MLFSRNHRSPLAILATILLLMIVSILFFQNSKSNRFRSQNCPTVEIMNGAEVIFQIPDSPKAALFLAHGCDGKASNFWDRSKNCPNCIGLPEERLMVLHAIARRFAVLTVSSAGRCWSFGDERLIVRDIIMNWVEERDLQSVPLFALGASSGGYFVSLLATDMHFHSIVLMIAEGVFHNALVSKNYPSTLFVHMPKDSRRARKVEENIGLLRSKAIEVGEIECREFPLSPSFFVERVPRLDMSTATKLFELIQENGFVDKHGYMKSDGRATPWKSVVKHSNVLKLDKYLASHIQEEMNLAYAYHEMTSLKSEEIFNWFESHMGN